MLKDNCTLLVMSCDKYESAWYPFFELLRKYWKDYPRKIVLCTETKSYSHKDMDIICSNSGYVEWSNRLYNALSQINTDYVILSLEDFFIQNNVDNEILEKCYEYMEKHPNVAQCRFKNCDNSEQLEQLGGEAFNDFYYAGKEVIYRVDTQVALWRKDILISFVKLNENPWQFETLATQRAIDTDYVFLWYKSKNDKYDTDSFVFPYQMSLESGYGISMGHWLWNNNSLFEKNDIYVDLSDFGVYSKRQVKHQLLKINAVYKKQPGLKNSIFRIIYRLVRKLIRIFSVNKNVE